MNKYVAYGNIQQIIHRLNTFFTYIVQLENTNQWGSFGKNDIKG